MDPWRNIMKTTKALAVAFFGFLACIATSAVCRIAFEADPGMILSDVYNIMAIVTIPLSIVALIVPFVFYYIEKKNSE